MLRTMKLPLHLVRKYERVVNNNGSVGLVGESLAEMDRADANIDRAARRLADEVLKLYRRRPATNSRRAKPAKD
jgi:hypothetical protein